MLMVANTDGSGEPKSIARRRAPDYFGSIGPSWSPDGKTIACGAGTLGHMTVVGVPAEGGAEWVLFTTNRTGTLTLWKVGINGGPAVQLSDMFAAYPTVSPDGKLIACYHPDEHGNHPLQLVIFPFEGGQPVKTINLPKTAGPFNGRPLWLPDGRSITFANRVNNVPNIWSQPLDGGPPKPVTNFKSLWLYNYAPSRDGKQIALSRGDQYQGIVLIKDFR